MSNSTPTADLRTIIIYTEAMDALDRFYREGLNLGTPEYQGEEHIGYRMPSVYFGFDQRSDITGTAPSRVTLWFTVDDLDATFKRFLQLGARVHFEPVMRPWGQRLAAVLDPDGNIVGLGEG